MSREVRARPVEQDGVVWFLISEASTSANVKPLPGVDGGWLDSGSWSILGEFLIPGHRAGDPMPRPE